MVRTRYEQQLSITNFSRKEVIKALIDYAYSQDNLFIEADEYELVIDEDDISVKSIYKVSEVKKDG